jgi:anti-sigma B factor antagonist
MSANDVSPGLVITRRDSTDRTAVLELAGYIDLSNGRQLTDAITKTIADVRDISLDLTGLTFVDSTGLREFVTGYHQAAAAGAGYRIVNPVGQVKQVLEMTGMLTFLTDGLSRAD